ncbi:MAG: DNA-directed RNA polymerase subunit K [Nanoarchaeota archaeon]|nr:DNA-directed RNA polymerase subunit K [Nanoarchaeota archaeon]
MQQTFTKYEISRIIGARALQIAMDAPLLLKISEKQLKEIRYDSLKIAQMELEEGVLPISINRPTPSKRKEKLSQVKVEQVSDEELIAREQEVEKEIVAEAEQLGFVNAGEDEGSIGTDAEGPEEQ